MDITCISDLHGHYPELEGGDLLIVAGDLTARDTEQEYALFDYWLNEQKYAAKIVIAGNHDNFLQTNGTNAYGLGNKYIQFGTYLQDAGCTFNELKIWGSPWTKTFEGMNPKCKAFTVDTEQELADKFSLIPDDIDILITHSPPYGILDGIPNKYDGTLFAVGSISLKNRIEKLLPEIVLFGHIHECGGRHVSKKGILYINGSVVNENYRVFNNGRRVHFNEKMPKMQRFKVVE